MAWAEGATESSSLPPPAAAAGACAQAKPMLVVANIANNPCLTGGGNRFIELTLIQKKDVAQATAVLIVLTTQQKIRFYGP